jgi:glucose dehydrogenase
VRWVFQTTHHDLWDYDLPAQPLLLDWPTSQGQVPALIQATKRGQIFVLDRRNGAPLEPVDEALAPKTDVPGEVTARTQPWSRAMPDLGGPPLREVDMWGMTPFDQLWCRIAFHRLRYDGPLTPPSLRGSIVSPGMAGGQNWGGVTVDRGRSLLIAPSLRLAYTLKLEPRSAHPKPSVRISPMAGTPYIADSGPFLSPLQTPCQRPPYALITAVDLLSHKVLWQRPLGTAQDLGPRNLKSHLPITIGAPPLVGGAITTAGGLIFIGAAGDNRLRALDTDSGRELWSAPLPEGDQATPMTYLAPKSGRQMLVMVSGGWANLQVGNPVPTHIIAYALP